MTDQMKPGFEGAALAGAVNTPEDVEAWTDPEYKSLPTLIRELREAAFQAGVEEGSWDGKDEWPARAEYRDAQAAIINRLDELGFR